MYKGIQSILALSKREFKIIYRNFSSILSIFLFFLLGVIIFVFSIGNNKETFSEIGVGIIWTLILLANTLSLKNFFQNDFDDDNIIIFHASGLSYEIIALVKIVIIWLFIQAPFFIIIPIAVMLLNIEFSKLEIIFTTFFLGSIIITCIASISGSMNLLNKKNFTLGSLILMLLSIPVIIFSVGSTEASIDMAKAQTNILSGIMFFFLAISPWICGMCIRISLQNK